MIKVVRVLAQFRSRVPKREMTDNAKDILDTFRYIEKKDKNLAEEFLLREISNVKTIMRAQNEINILKSIINLKETEIEEEKKRALDILQTQRQSKTSSKVYLLSNHVV